ncbi:MAG TPA: hypothetical protein VH309_09955 [Elusimicrobiota bacterium]|jgi:hypothetical protein|nr:hypothetical protein [Elusimicrobiota bacterium]
MSGKLPAASLLALAVLAAGARPARARRDESAANGNFVSWNLLAEHMLEEARTGADPTSFGR